MSDSKSKGEGYATGYGWVHTGWHNHHVVVTFNAFEQAGDQRRLAHEAASLNNPNIAGHNFYREWMERTGEIER